MDNKLVLTWSHRSVTLAVYKRYRNHPDDIKRGLFYRRLSLYFSQLRHVLLQINLWILMFNVLWMRNAFSTALYACNCNRRDIHSS